MEQYYSLGEVARFLDVAPYRIVYLHTAGKLPEPQRLFGRRAYNWSDVVGMAEHFDVDLKHVHGDGKSNHSTGGDL
ncbi:MAG: hypothetical protein ACYC0X_23610 [Pirellulaceae bacterium]